MLFLSCPFPKWNCPYPITAVFGTYGILSISAEIANRNTKLKELLGMCGNYSCDIYILSYYVQQFIRVIVFHMLGISYIVVFLAEILLGGSLSVLISKTIIRKNKVLKALILGEWQ